jgi:hypothetical protein
MANRESKKGDGIQPIPIAYDNPWFTVLGDRPANNLLIANWGIRFKHFIALPDPLFQKEIGALRMSHDQEENYQFITDTDDFYRENGFLYVFQGYVYGVFTSNKKDLLSIAASLENYSGAMLSVNRYYENSPDYCRIAEYDKLIPCDLPEEFHTVQWEKFNASRTNVDRLMFKVCRVQFLIDSDGVRYAQDQDFIITDKGVIQWNEGAGPGSDTTTGIGKVCSVRYEYKPYFYCKSVLKDIRFWPSLGESGGPESRTAPQLVLVQSDWIFLDRRNANENDAEVQLNAEDGGNFGPR